MLGVDTKVFTLLFVPTRDKRLGAFVNRECARHVSQNPLEIFNGNKLRKTKQV